MEGRIVELEVALEAAQKGELRDRQTISKLSKQLSRVSSVFAVSSQLICVALLSHFNKIDFGKCVRSSGWLGAV